MWRDAFSNQSGVRCFMRVSVALGDQVGAMAVGHRGEPSPSHAGTAAILGGERNKVGYASGLGASRIVHLGGAGASKEIFDARGDLVAGRRVPHLQRREVRAAAVDLGLFGVA